MPNMYRMIALSAALAMGFFGIFLGMFWQEHVNAAYGGFLIFLVWCCLWLVPAIVISLMLVSVLNGDDRTWADDIALLSVSLALAALGGMAAYYAYVHMYDGAIYYALYGVPLFLLPVVWFTICQTDCMKTAVEDSRSGLPRYKPYLR